MEKKKGGKKPQEESHKDVGGLEDWKLFLNHILTFKFL